jgi:hypothetical protein
VPGLSDRSDHFDGVAALARSLPNLLGVEVMAYHGLGASKLSHFGMELACPISPETPEPDTVARWVRGLRERGLTVLNET